MAAINLIADITVVDTVDTATRVDGVNETVVTNKSVIDMGTGANDLVVLNSHIESDHTLDFSAAWNGKVSVVNFFDAQTAAGAPSTVGDHILDFSAFLNDERSASGSTLSEARHTATSLVDVAAGVTLASNELSIVNDFLQTSATAGTFANLTAAAVDAAITGTTAYGNLGTSTSATLVASHIGTNQSSVLMIENDLNAGEYKVFNVETATPGTATEEHVVTLLGTIDFGASIDATVIVA
jgi:hypothetical protein